MTSQREREPNVLKCGGQSELARVQDELPSNRDICLGQIAAQILGFATKGV